MSRTTLRQKKRRTLRKKRAMSLVRPLTVKEEIEKASPGHAKCSPLMEGAPSCLDNETIQSMVAAWNAVHPSDPVTGAPVEFLKQRMTQCRNQDERCLPTQLLSFDQSRRVLKKNFAPSSPTTWLKNKNEWLTSEEIIDHLKQFEVAYPAFKFMGPSPSDFFYKERADDRCAWPELCEFDLAAYLKKGKTKFGVSFNVDTHESDGSHWVSMFVNAAAPVVGIYYFDSAGDPIIKNIAVFRDMVIKQAKKLGMASHFMQNSPVAHQKGSSECGMYSLFFLTTMLEYDKLYEAQNKEQLVFDQLQHFMKGGGESFFETTFKNPHNLFSDSLMEKLRNVYFNRP